MWTVVYMTKDENNVNILEKNFGANNIISMKRKRNDYYKILVPSMEVSMAHGIIIDTEI
ncbi:MAG: hypothetical protein PUB42_06740 [Firmicutes bacterium]|nr:hypothetical protein [Bacillota bacterium]